MTMKTDGTGSIVSEVSFDEETLDSRSQNSSFLEVTVADEHDDEHDASHTRHRHVTNADGKIVSTGKGKLKGSSKNLSPQAAGNRARCDSNNSGFSAGNRARCDTSDSGFSLVLRPDLDRDVSALTECLVPASPSMSIPQSPAFRHSSNDHQTRPKRKDSGFDLVVSNHSIPMSTLTMTVDSASERGSTTGGPVAKHHDFGDDFHQKWLNSTPRNVDGTILEDESEDSFRIFESDGSSSCCHFTPVSLIKPPKQPRGSKKKATKSLRPKGKENIKSSSKPKSVADKGKISKPILATKQDSARSLDSKSSRRSSSASKGKTSKPAVVAKPDSSHSRSGSKSKSKSKKKKKSNSSIKTKNTLRDSAKSEERDQSTPNKNGKFKENERDGPSSPDSKKSIKRRRSKNKESRQDGSLSPDKVKKQSSEKRISLSPKMRNSSSSSSPRTPKGSKSRKSTKAKASKTTTRKTSKNQNDSSGIRKDPPEEMMDDAESCTINNRTVPAIPIKPTVVMAQTSDSSSSQHSGWWSLTGSSNPTKSRFSTMEGSPTTTTKFGKMNLRMPMMMDAPKSPSMFGKLRRSTKARVRS
ncbi:unnamed protein product [Cylindrotheca closterium]|uniref:Uncharacterized protein n=1 Tax=Cylindrotheca closterium TaxID=2856 RepID=A0AAD2FIS3_9STRA|nr:unnamed protein product [Cylindrotheca closterium]